MDVRGIKLSTFGSICLLCLKTKTCTSVKSDPEKHLRSRLACIKYIVLISKYLKLDSELFEVALDKFPRFKSELEAGIVTDELDLKEDVNKFVICDLCSPVVDSFCTIYQQYEVVKLKLEEKIWEATMLVDKSTDALGGDRVGSNGLIRNPSHQKKTAAPPKEPNAESSGENSADKDKEDLLTGFRGKLRRAGTDARKSSGPRVNLKRSQKAEELIKSKVLKKSTDPELIRIKNNANTTYIRIIRQKPPLVTEQVQKTSTDSEALSPFETKIEEDDIKVVHIAPPPGPRIVSTSTLPPTTLPLQLDMGTVLPQSLRLPISVWAPPPPLNNNSVEGPTIKKVINGIIAQPSPRQICNVNGCSLQLPKNVNGSFSMQQHFLCHDKMVCKVCALIFNSPLELASHELEHSTCDQPFGFKCSRCSCFFSLRTEYQEHFLQVHLTSFVELVKCFMCKKGFHHLKRKQFDLHVAKSHPTPTENLSQCYECDICHVYFKKRGVLWKHLKFDHKINSVDGSFRCHFCAESYFLNIFLELHQEFSCSRPDGLFCPDLNCNFQAGTRKALKTHFKMKGPDFKVPECPICKVRLYDRNFSKFHMMTHNGEQVTFTFPTGTSDVPTMYIPMEGANQNAMPPVSVQTTVQQPVHGQVAAPVESDIFDEMLRIHGMHIPHTSTQVSMPVTIPVSMSTPVSIPVSIPMPMAAPAPGPSRAHYINPVQIPCTNAWTTDTKPDLGVPAVAHMHQSNTVILEPSITSKFFQEGDDGSNSEPLMYFGQIPMLEDVGTPDEDPFSWILPEDIVP